MNTIHTTQPKPQWVAEQEAAGNTVIHVAPRPLYGDAREDTWAMPFLRGRHYAALNPNGEDYTGNVKRNTTLDASRVVYVTESEALETGKAWYRSKFAEERFTDEQLEEYRDHIIAKGIQSMDEGEQ
jgi:hypothetical protein